MMPSISHVTAIFCEESRYEFQTVDLRLQFSSRSNNSPKMQLCGTAYLNSESFRHAKEEDSQLFSMQQKLSVKNHADSERIKLHLKPSTEAAMAPRQTCGTSR